MSCAVCGRDSTVSRTLGACAACIRSGRPGARERAERAHGSLRKAFGDPAGIPREKGGTACRACFNACRPAEGGRGVCGIRSLRRGEVGLHEGPSLSWYYDPLPTNCVGTFVCPGGTGAGYPRYAVRRGPERGMKNLAVFYHSCSFNCLFCQNWHFREVRREPGSDISAAQLAEAVDDRTTCICYFGGDPGTQSEHALEAARLALGKARGRPLRICWETNGSASRDRFEAMTALSLESGGCVKVDLKAFDPNLHRALTGCSNRGTLKNFERLAAAAAGRPDPPLALASTLLVPGYVDAGEVAKIAGFIAGLDPSIPYSLLAFYPNFAMGDLPVTSRRQADACLEAARDAGLRRVHLGNRHLLGMIPDLF